MTARQGDDPQWVPAGVGGHLDLYGVVRWWDGQRWGRTAACPHHHRSVGPAEDCANREARRRNRDGVRP